MTINNGLMVGYGKSDKPHGSSTHIEYSKRVMADDMVQLMYVSLTPPRQFLPSPDSPLLARNEDTVLIIGTNLATLSSR
jgi:hypothetical protein